MKKMKWVICSCCHGEGKVVHEAFSSGFTSSEWHAMDLEDQQSYKTGAYDVICTDCNGRGSVQVPNVAAMTFTEKREYVLEQRAQRLDREINAEMAAERRFGC
jgi:RecJ-like exonuclease